MIGVCGGVDPSLAVGDLVVPDVVVDRARDPVPPRPAGRAPGEGGPGSATVRCARDEPVARVRSAALDELRAVGATAVDMETAAVALACDERAVPWSVLRAVSDVSPTASSTRRPRPDPVRRSDRPAAVAHYVFRRPWAVHRLARLGAAPPTRCGP